MDKEAVLLLLQRVQEAQRVAARELKDSGMTRDKDGKGGDDDEDEIAAMLTHRKRPNGSQRGGKSHKLQRK